MIFKIVLWFLCKMQKKTSQYKSHALSCHALVKFIKIMGKIIGSMSSFSSCIPEKKAEEITFLYCHLICCCFNSEASNSYTNHFTCCIWTSMKPPTCWVVSSWLEVKGQIHPFGVLSWLTHKFVLHLHLIEQIFVPASALQMVVVSNGKHLLYIGWWRWLWKDVYCA